MTQLSSQRAQRLMDRVAYTKERIERSVLRPMTGRVVDVRSGMVRVAFDGLRIGETCRLYPDQESPAVLARVVSIEKETALVSPLEHFIGLSSNAWVERDHQGLEVPVDDVLLGRVVSGLGKPVDGLGAFPDGTPRLPVRREAQQPMSRPLVTQSLATGIRAIDGLLTLGRGQRVALFGPPGTGKSSLLAAIAQHSDADVIVIGMIGERGREVREFLDLRLPRDKRKRTVVVAVTSDRSAMERIEGAHVATAIAEGFRDQGRSVLLLIDSLTRVARAQREVGLAAGEPPTRRGYPASVYAELPKLVERAGNSPSGDMSAIYTVLVEGDGSGDPIAEEARSLTDGHIILSQDIAESGRYPAIDVLKSLSRVMGDIVAPDQETDAKTFRRRLAKYNEIELLIQVGEYVEGTDPESDAAIRCKSAMDAFLEQESTHPSLFDETVAKLAEALS